MFRFLGGGSSYVISKTPKTDTFVGRRSFHVTPNTYARKAIGEFGATPNRTLSKRDQLNIGKIYKLLNQPGLWSVPNLKQIQQFFYKENPAARGPLAKQILSIAQDWVAKKFNANTDPEFAAFGKTMNDEYVTKGEENQDTNNLLNYLAKLGFARIGAAEQQQEIMKGAKPPARSAIRGALPGKQRQAITKIAKPPARSVKIGSRNQNTAEAAARGRKWHRWFALKVKGKRGWQSEPRLMDPKTGKIVIPDAITSSGRPLELKPNTPSGRAKGKQQLPQYERATGKKGRVVYYDPNKPTPETE
jgi:hypothetical protein